jgi:hypothetical protein
MKLMEIPNGGMDMMTIMCLGQTTYMHFDQSLTMDEKMETYDRVSMIGTLFCGVALHLMQSYESEGFKLGNSMMSINEEGIRDGVYVYMTKDPDPYTVPELDKTIDGGFMMYGCYDMADPFIEIWFSDKLICTLKTATTNGRVIVQPHMIDVSNVDDKQLKEMVPIISGGIMNSLTQLNLARMSGYKAGQKAAMEEAAEAAENAEEEN